MAEAEAPGPRFARHIPGYSSPTDAVSKRTVACNCNKAQRLLVSGFGTWISTLRRIVHQYLWTRRRVPSLQAPAPSPGISNTGQRRRKTVWRGYRSASRRNLRSSSTHRRDKGPSAVLHRLRSAVRLTPPAGNLYSPSSVLLFAGRDVQLILWDSYVDHVSENKKPNTELAQLLNLTDVRASGRNRRSSVVESERLEGSHTHGKEKIPTDLGAGAARSMGLQASLEPHQLC